MAKKNLQKTPKEEVAGVKKALLKADSNVFEKIPSSNQNAILVEQKMEMHIGPIPDAASLAKYDKIIPDGANRIMKMAEEQQIHRIEIEHKVALEQLNQSGKGQWFGFVLGIIGLAGGVHLGVNGFEIVGGIIGGGTVVSLVSVFVAGKVFKK